MRYLTRGLVLPALLAASCGSSAATSPTASTAVATPAPTAASASAAPTSAPVGAITGKLGYPSDFIPPLTVYAVSVADQRIFFSVDTPRYPTATNFGTPSYTISGIAPGTYTVFAYRNDNDPNWYGGPGLHSQYLLKCVPPPATSICTDHSLLPVTLKLGETVAQIDVMDWYYDAQQRTYPPRPQAVFATTECTNATATTRQVLERYLALASSNNPQAVTDCFAKVWRDKLGSGSSIPGNSFADSAAVWSHSGPVAGVAIMFGDTVNGCDRFSVSGQLANASPTAFRIASFFSVGPEGGLMRIYESSTGLVNASLTALHCP